MTDGSKHDLADYFSEAESWSRDTDRVRLAWHRYGWIAASVVSVIAMLEAVALVALMPLKTVEPYTLLVDRQTGYVQALKPLNQQMVGADTALTHSFLAQYVIAREGFDIDNLRDEYRKVSLWSAGDARAGYIAAMQQSNPASPLAALPRQAMVEVQIRSVSPLGSDTSLVRFTTNRVDPGGRRQPPQPWASVIKYRFSGADMSAADRLVNPLGFQVLRYHRDAEIPPAPEPQVSTLMTAPMPSRAIPAENTAPSLPPAVGSSAVPALQARP